MKILEITLENYIGIFQGTQKKKIHITFGTNRITLIRALNGKGKSTLLSAISLLPDNNTDFIPGEEGKKSLVVINGGTMYKIYISHPVDKDGNRKKTTANIYMVNGDIGTDLNPSGNITSYKEILSTEFDLDPSYSTLSFLGADQKGMAARTPSERISIINNLLEYVDGYNEMRKVLTKRSSIFKSLINRLTEKIDLLGSKDELVAELDRNNKMLHNLHMERSNIVDIIARDKANIDILDKDKSIQNTYRGLINKRNTLLALKADSAKALSIDEVSLMSNKGFTSMEDTEATIINFNNKKEKLSYEMENIRNDLKRSIDSKEAKMITISTIKSRIDSLLSDKSPVEIRNMIKHISDRIETIKEYLNSKGIIDYNSLSKDELVNALETIIDIYNRIESIQSCNEADMLNTVISKIQSGVNHYQLNNTILKLKDDIEINRDKLSEINKELDRKIRDLEIYETMKSKRPSNCNIDNCPYIKDAIDILTKGIPNISIVEQEAKQAYHIIKEMTELKETLERESELMKIIADLIEYCNTIGDRMQYTFRKINNEIRQELSSDNILSMINNHVKKFSCLDDAYELIQEANVVEELRESEVVHSQLVSELSVIETKEDTINDLTKELNDINEDLTKILSDINTANDKITQLDDEIYELDYLIKKANKLHDYYYIVSDNNRIIKELDKEISSREEEMVSINQSLSNLEISTNRLKELDEIIKPLEDEVISIQHSIGLLAEYDKELKEYSNSYTKLEVLKTYTTPSKKGIQNLFIDIYMNQTLKIANHLLGMFFNGRLKLLPYDIKDGSFSIPCFSSLTGLQIEDISYCSRSERAMADLALSGALLVQSSSRYNILRLDEQDDGLDVTNRMQFLSAVNTICNILNIEQCILISHTSELQVDGNIDVIQIGDSTELGEISGNIISQL